MAERKEPRQKLTLSWQLADVYEKQGNIPAAEKTFLESAESVAGTIMRLPPGRMSAGSMNAMGYWRPEERMGKGYSGKPGKRKSAPGLGGRLRVDPSVRFFGSSRAEARSWLGQ